MAYKPTGKPIGRPPSEKMIEAARLLADGASGRSVMKRLGADFRMVKRAKAILAANKKENADD